MTRYLLAGAAALGLMTSAAMAQSSMTTTTTTVPSGPVTVAATATSGRAVLPDADQTATSAWSSRESNGNNSATTVTNQTYPLTGMITSTRKSTNVANGVATETTVTTNTYPPSYMRPPETSTSTRTYTVGAQ